MKRTFAPGWTQVINTADPKQERADLACYISDTFKAINGIRPRWMDFNAMSLEDLRKEADTLEHEVHIEADRERAREAHRQAEMAAHHLAVSKAMKPIAATFKPFANLKELLV